jgi:hypothetical protein
MTDGQHKDLSNEWTLCLVTWVNNIGGCTYLRVSLDRCYSISSRNVDHNVGRCRNLLTSCLVTIALEAIRKGVHTFKTNR